MSGAVDNGRAETAGSLCIMMAVSIAPPQNDTSERVLQGVRRRWKLILAFVVLSVAGFVYAAIRGNWVAGDVLGGSGLMVSVAGFTLSIWLLIRGVRLVEATHGAVLGTLNAVAASRLYAAVTELQMIEEAVEAAALHDDRATARSLLNRW